MNRDEWVMWYLENIGFRISSFEDPVLMAENAYRFANTMLKLNQFTFTK